MQWYTVVVVILVFFACSDRGFTQRTPEVEPPPEPEDMECDALER